MMYLWLSLFVIFVITEAMTAQLTTIWFALGSLCSFFVSVAGGDTWLQWVVGVAVSIIALFATRPIVKKISTSKMQPTNADRYIGVDAVVMEKINNLNATGQIKASGTVWTARSADDTIFEKDEIVTIIEIKGVKAIVTRKK